MTPKTPRDPDHADRPKAAVDTREGRLKTALRDNLAKRKAQARARAADASKAGPPRPAGD